MKCMNETSGGTFSQIGQVVPCTRIHLLLAPIVQNKWLAYFIATALPVTTAESIIVFLASLLSLSNPSKLRTFLLDRIESPRGVSPKNCAVNAKQLSRKSNLDPNHCIKPCSLVEIYAVEVTATKECFRGQVAQKRATRFDGSIGICLLCHITAFFVVSLFSLFIRSAAVSLSSISDLPSYTTSISHFTQDKKHL